MKELLLRGYKPTIAVLCKDSAAVHAAVQKGMGVGMLTGDSVKNSIESGSLIRLNVPELKKIALQSFIVFDQQKPLSPIAKDLLSLLRNRRLRGALLEEVAKDLDRDEIIVTGIPRQQRLGARISD